MTSVPQDAIDLAKRFEGFCRVPKSDPGWAYPYVCPAGFWTIGYGHLCDQAHPPITLAQGEANLEAAMQLALRATLGLCPVLATEPETRFGGMVYFAVSLEAGRPQTSTTRRRINQKTGLVRRLN
jgi:lysozyme